MSDQSSGNRRMGWWALLGGAFVFGLGSHFEIWWLQAPGAIVGLCALSYLYAEYVPFPSSRPQKTSPDEPVGPGTEIVVGALTVAVTWPEGEDFVGDPSQLGKAIEIEITNTAQRIASWSSFPSTRAELTKIRAGSFYFDFVIYATIQGAVTGVLSNYKGYSDGLVVLLKDSKSLYESIARLARHFARNAQIEYDLELETHAQTEARLEAISVQQTLHAKARA